MQTNASKKEVECRVTGRVQMVMFRDFAQRKARLLGIKGTVQNLSDGSVRIVARGSEKMLEKLIEHLHKGPFLARVVHVEVLWREPTKKYNEFHIIY